MESIEWITFNTFVWVKEIWTWLCPLIFKSTMPNNYVSSLIFAFVIKITFLRNYFVFSPIYICTIVTFLKNNIDEKENPE